MSRDSRVRGGLNCPFLVNGGCSVFFFQAEDGIRDIGVTGVQTCALPILDLPAKLLAGFFQGANPRTAGFNSVDYAAMRETSWLVTDILMFIGAGSAGTGGGIKVTTFIVLALAIRAEARGEPTVDAFGRRIPASAQRQALSVALIGLGAVVVATLLLTSLSPFPLSRTLFETVSAFGTVGLSTGITAQ